MAARATPHQTDVSRPPPQIDDSFPHPTLLEQLRVADEHCVQQFLACVPSANTPHESKPSPSPMPVNIGTYREELREALRVLQTLHHSMLVLEELKEDDPNWKEEVQRAEQLKSLLVDSLLPLEDANRKEQLAHKLTIRQKKRAWQKRRNERLKANRTAQQASRVERLREIATWQADWQERLNQERIAREELQMKTHILTDVRRRKARAKRVLGRFEKSLRLRQQRQRSKPTIDPELEESFRKRMDTLVTEWSGKLNECVKEEKRLKDELNRQTVGNAGRRRENRWRKVLFGSAAQSALAAGRRSNKEDLWQELVTVRRAWDKFCLPFEPNNSANNAGGSVAPSTWILPPEQPLPEWGVYRDGGQQIKHGKESHRYPDRSSARAVL